MKYVTLKEGVSNITPWGKRAEVNKTFGVADPSQLEYFEANSRYQVTDYDPRQPGSAPRPPSRPVARNKAQRAGRREVQPEPVEQIEPEPPEAVEFEIQVGPDLSLLDGSVREITLAIETGDFDEQIDELIAAEQAGKTRKSAVAALEARLAELNLET